MKNFTLLVFALLAPLFLSNSHASNVKEQLFFKASEGHKPLSYRSARLKLFNEIYLEKNRNGSYVEGVYCQRRFYRSHDNPYTVPDHTKFNTEHTWPQSKFTRQFPKHFQKSDLHHLFPSFSRINSQRANYYFAEVISRRNLFCDESAIGSPTSGRGGPYFEPPDEHKGNVARAMFYFSVRYRASIHPTQERFLRLWHKEDPVDEQEQKRHEMIYKAQGNRNPFIDNPAFVSKIKNF